MFRHDSMLTLCCYWVTCLFRGILSTKLTTTLPAVHFHIPNIGNLVALQGQPRDWGIQIGRNSVQPCPVIKQTIMKQSWRSNMFWHQWSLDLSADWRRHTTHQEQLTAWLSQRQISTQTSLCSTPRSSLHPTVLKLPTSLPKTLATSTSRSHPPVLDMSHVLPAKRWPQKLVTGDEQYFWNAPSTLPVSSLNNTVCTVQGRPFFAHVSDTAQYPRSAMRSANLFAYNPY